MRNFQFPIPNFQRLLRAREGFGLIEIVVVVAIVSVSVIAFGEVARLALSALRNEKSALEGSMLVEEGFEGVRALRDQGWSVNINNLANGATYYLATTTAGANASWSLTTTAPTRYINGKHWRTLVFGAVTRNAGDQIASSGTIDNGTRQLTVTVSWRGSNATSSVTSSGYITNFLQN